MNPKKAKDFRKSTAEEVDLPEDLVNKFIEFYWVRVRKAITELEYPAISIYNLGTFSVKHWRIPETIEAHKKTIQNAGGKFAAYKRQLDYLDRINKLDKIKKLVDIRELKFKEIKDARKIKNNMEEQAPDMGGLEEQSDQETFSGEDS